MGRGHTFKEKTRILLQVLRINLKKSLITLVGMTIALAIITASLIYLESNEIDYYIGVLKNSEFEKQLIFHVYGDSEGNYSFKDITLIQNAVNEKITEFNLNNTIIQSNYPFQCRMNRKILFRNTSELHYFRGISMDESIIKDCVKGSKIPGTPDEVLIFIPSNDPIELDINETIHFSLFYEENNNEKSHNISLKISGMLTASSIRSSSQLWYMVSEHNRIQIIMNIKQYLELLNTLRTLSDETISNRLELYYSFDFSTVNHQNAIQIIDRLLEFGRMGWDFQIQVVTPRESTWYDIYISSMSWYYMIQDSVSKFSMFFFLFTVLCIPAFIITFLLVNFSLGVINEGRRKTLTLYKMRGVSKKFILTMLCVEILSLAFIASILGLILGLPVYFLISTTTGYLSFDLTKWPNFTIVSQATVTTVIGFSLCFTFLLHLSAIIKLVNARIVHLEEEASKKKKRKRGTIRQNIDIFLLSQGIIGILLLNLLMEILYETGMIESGLAVYFMGFIFIFAFLSPLSLLVGFIFAFNRLMPVMLEKLGGLLWKKDFKFLAVATRNLFVNIKLTTRTTLLIAVTVSFLMILSSLPLSLNQHIINTTYYKAGSDLVIQTWDLVDENAIRNLSTKLHELPGLTTTLVSFNDYGEIEIMGIEDNFDNVAFWKSHYAKQPLSNLVSALYSSKSQFPVIIDSSSARIEKITVNDNYLLNLDNQNPLSLTIVSKTDYWPGLIERHRDEERFLIIKISNYFDLISEDDSYIWCKIDPSFDKDEVLEQAKNVTLGLGVDIRSFHPTTEKLDLDPKSLEVNFLWIITNFNFLVALLVLLLFLFLFTITRITNQLKEIGLSRALGMKFHQIFLLMFIEPFLLVLISGLPGGLIGLGLLMTVINFGQGPPFSYDPPFILMIDFPSIFLIFGSILITAVMSGFITSYRATRADVSKILKVE
ncbi:MAG: FtsX-like permease family protein [Promethearchaeota archaeon]